jgi:hypothetical protein
MRKSNSIASTLFTLGLASMLALGCAPSEQDEPEPTDAPAAETIGTSEQTGSGTCLPGSAPACLGREWNSMLLHGGYIQQCRPNLAKKGSLPWGACTLVPITPWCGGGAVSCPLP